jgi:hypothetical protein
VSGADVFVGRAVGGRVEVDRMVGGTGDVTAPAVGRDSVEAGSVDAGLVDVGSAEASPGVRLILLASSAISNKTMPPATPIPIHFGAIRFTGVGAMTVGMGPVGCEEIPTGLGRSAAASLAARAIAGCLVTKV